MENSGIIQTGSDSPLNPFISEPEKRRTLRALSQMSVGLQVEDTPVPGAKCLSISPSGMFIHTDYPIPVGASGSVTLRETIESRCYAFGADFTVVRREERSSRGPGIGVSFLQISEDNQKALKEIVEYQRSLMAREKLVIAEEKMIGFQCKIARSTEELEAACRIVHDSYVQAGYMDPQPSGLRLTLHHALPKTTIFLVTRDEQFIATSTLFPDSPLGLPMDSLYREELNRLRLSGRILGEVGSLAVHREFREPNPTLPLFIHKMIYRYALENLKMDDTVLTINPRHQLYYQHVMLCEKIGEEKSYQTVNGNPAIALRNDLATLKPRFEVFYDGFPPEKNMHGFYCREHKDIIQLPPEGEAISLWNGDLVRYYFEKVTDVFARADQKSVQYIKGLYGL